jgi:hypothetical protein
MEEKDTGESDPVDLQCAEQTDLVSLIISGEEEATQEESDLGNCSLLGGKLKKLHIVYVYCPHSTSPCVKSTFFLPAIVSQS